MLGLGRASQYAGWWSGKPTARMEVPVELNQAVYQTPSYSMQYGQNSFSSAVYPSDAVIDLSTFLTVPNTNNSRSVMFVTFQMNFESGIAPGVGNFITGFMHNARFAQGEFYPNTEFWGLNTFIQFRDNELDITGRIETPTTIARTVSDLPGGYEAYNNRWLTYIFSMAETYTVFSNWSGATNTARYLRTALWDTETREVIQVLDATTNADFPAFVQYANQVTDLPMNRDGEYGMSDGIVLSNGFPDGLQPIRFSQLWSAFGTTFDPANPPDSTVFTTRPNNTIGNAVAWYNTQYVEYVTSGTDYYVKDQGETLYSQPNDRMIDIGNNTQFTAGYSDTIIPKDRS
jgi:hypothetical protein